MVILKNSRGSSALSLLEEGSVEGSDSPWPLDGQSRLYLAVSWTSATVGCWLIVLEVNLSHIMDIFYFNSVVQYLSRFPLFVLLTCPYRWAGLCQRHVANITLVPTMRQAPLQRTMCWHYLAVGKFSQITHLQIKLADATPSVSSRLNPWGRIWIICVHI